MIEIRIYGELYWLLVLFLLTQISGGFGQEVVRPSRCNGVEYNDVCYWTTHLPNNSSSPECPGGELGIVSDNRTWNYVTRELAAQISKYASLKLGLGLSQVVPVETGTSFYDLYGRSLPGLKDQVESTNQCFIWDISNLVIKGVSCGGLSFKYRALCSFSPNLDEEKNCTDVGGVEINSKCFWISTTTFGDVEKSQLFCFKNEGYLAPISDLQELNLILDSPLPIASGKDKTKDISLGLTIYKNNWTTLQGEIPQYFRFPSGVNTNIDEKGCVYVNRDWVWEVSRCNDRYKVVCQNKTDYWFEIDRYTFYDAHTLCASKGGKLAVPKNLQEHVAIQSIADTQGDRLWVGITRDPWYTYTGELVQWFNWKNIDDKELIDCVIVEEFTSPFPWTSRQCSNKQDYGLCSKNTFEDDNCIGAIYNNTTCYWVTSMDVTAPQADEQCRSNGGSLAVLTNSQTDDFLTSSFQEVDSFKVWIGITKLKKRWYSSIGEQTWFNWYKSGRSSPFTVESCVTFSAKNNFQWSIGCPVVSANDTLEPGNFCMKKLNSTITTETPSTEPTTQTTASDTQDTSMAVTTTPPGNLNTSGSDKENDTTASTMSWLTSPRITAPTTTPLASTPTKAPATEPITSESASESSKSSLTSVPKTSPRTTTLSTTQLTSPPKTAPTAEINLTLSLQSPTTTVSAAESTKSSLTSVPTTTSGIKQSTQPLEPILSPLNKCGVKITYPSTGRFWNIPCLCSCNICKKRPNFRNISDAAVVEEMKSKIKKTLTVPKDKISALLNKKISQVDERASSTSIGLVTACVLVAILAFFLISDVIKIIYIVKNNWTTFR